MLLLTIVLGLVALVCLYVWYMSSRHGELKKKFGIDGPKTIPVLGNVKSASFIDDGIKMYNEFKHTKVFATYFARTASLNVTDLDMIRDIMTRNFNSFAARQEPQKFGNVLDSMITAITGEHWKHVRTQLTPAFSSGKIKRMSKLIQRTSKMLTENLIEKMESNEEVELQTAFAHFSMDAVASTAFAVDLDSAKDPNNPFITKAKAFVNGFGKFLFVLIFAPFLFPVFRFLGIHLFDQSLLAFFSNFTDRVIKERRSEGSSGKRNDFVQLLIEAENENAEKDEGEGDEKHVVSRDDGEQTGTGKKFHGLTDSEIQAAALSFILAGYDNISRVMSFTMFLLASNPDCLAKVQEELDAKLGSKEPDYDSLGDLTYLDMCINEAMRLYPPGFILQRYCTEDTEVQGFHFPAGYTVNFHVYSIQRDPAYWEEPDKFDPERFIPGRKDDRHPYSYMPFGYGPRNCIGMRLSQMEMRMGLATLLQKVTPVTCDKTTPVKLKGIRMEAEGGLWVKLEPRSKTASI